MRERRWGTKGGAGEVQEKSGNDTTEGRSGGGEERGGAGREGKINR